MYLAAPSSCRTLDGLFENSTKSSCNTRFKLTTHWKTTAVKVIRDGKKRKKSTPFEGQCISTKVPTGDTIFTSHTGDGTAILRGHLSHTKV